jgi:hypothetical protein
VNLSWGSSTDNVGVTGYEIFRNGTFLATATATATSYSDPTATPSTTYGYRVRSLDAAGNRSAFGNTATVTTPLASALPGSTLTVAPQADARVEESSPSTNYGSSYLRTDGGGSAHVDSYLKFAVSGVAGSVQSAKLRVYAYTDTVDGPAVYTSGTGWSESTITWASRPTSTSGAIDDRGTVASGTWVEYNATPVVTGNGTYSFRLATTSSDGLDMRSREYTDAGSRPELVLKLDNGGGGAHPPGSPLHVSDPFSPIGIDRLAPRLALGGRTTQRLVRRAVIAAATCDEPCTVTATAKLSFGRTAASFRSRRLERTLGAGVRGKLKLTFSRRAVRAARRALRRGQRVFASVTVHSRDSAGNSSTGRRKIRLKH